MIIMVVVLRWSGNLFVLSIASFFPFHFANVGQMVSRRSTMYLPRLVGQVHSPFICTRSFSLFLTVPFFVRRRRRRQLLIVIIQNGCIPSMHNNRVYPWRRTRLPDNRFGCVVFAYWLVAQLFGQSHLVAQLASSSSSSVQLVDCVHYCSIIRIVPNTVRSFVHNGQVHGLACSCLNGYIIFHARCHNSFFHVFSSTIRLGLNREDSCPTPSVVLVGSIPWMFRMLALQLWLSFSLLCPFCRFVSFFSSGHIGDISLSHKHSTLPTKRHDTDSMGACHSF